MLFTSCGPSGDITIPATGPPAPDPPRTRVLDPQQSFGGQFISALALAQHQAQTVDGTRALLAISCPSNDRCYAAGIPGAGISDAGFDGTVVAIVGGVAGSPITIPGMGFIHAIACPTQTNCYVAGGISGPSGDLIGAIVALTDGVPGAAQTVSSSREMTAIACPSPTSCYAVGRAVASPPVVASVTNGTVAAVLPVPGTTSLDGIACVIQATCYAVGSTGSRGDAKGVVVPVQGGVPGQLQILADAPPLRALTCTSTDTCLAAGGRSFSADQGFIVSIVNGVAGLGEQVQGTDGLAAIACRDAHECEAASVLSAPSTGVIMPISDGMAGTPERVKEAGTLLGVACTPNGHCYAVGGALPVLIEGPFESVGVVVSIP